jgi:hypothetical protein
MSICRWCPPGRCQCEGLYEDPAAVQPLTDDDPWFEVYMPGEEGLAC